jgi:hypothetical protein
MKSVKDEPDHKKCKGVYKIECSCGKCYIGEIGCSFQIKIKEHGADIKNECTRTSALAEHSFSSKHHIHLEDKKILAKEDHFFKRRIKEAIEILKHPNNLNRDNGLEISEKLDSSDPRQTYQVIYTLTLKPRFIYFTSSSFQKHLNFCNPPPPPPPPLL